MDILKNILISIPMISSMTCGTIFFIVFHRSLSPLENRIRQTLGGYYISMVVLWLLTSFSTLDNIYQPYLIPIFFLLIQIIHVAFYHFICYIIPLKEKFNLLHYKLAAAIFLMTVVLTYLLSTTAGFNQLNLDHFFYQYLYVYVCLNSVCYTSLCWLRFYTNSKEIASDPEAKSKFNWIKYLLILRTMYLILFIFNIKRIVIIDIILVLLVATQHILTTYNILQRNIVDKIFNDSKKNILLSSGQIVSIDNKGTIENIAITANDIIKKPIDANSLLSENDIIDYFATKKPFLDKNYKLDDLVSHFHVNRTYMSKFINTTFSLNFNQLINNWRLKEIDELVSKSGDLSLEEIILKVGFSNYRHYLRAKENYEQLKK
ncbi:helix-turn-helix domain-containing protein [Myroides odoratus]|nr:helix-turn-helix domain-containing protein [Myroides odoratus]